MKLGQPPLPHPLPRLLVGSAVRSIGTLWPSHTAAKAPPSRRGTALRPRQFEFQSWRMLAEAGPSDRVAAELMADFIASTGGRR